MSEMSSDFEIVANPAGATSATTLATAAASLNHQWSVMTDPSSAESGDPHHRRRQKRRPCCCARCWTVGCTWLTSALGVSLLLLVYLMTGAVMFMVLGNQDHQTGQLQGAVGLEADGRLLEKTMATVDRLWSITEDLNILYRDNWTHLARVEMRHYQDQMVRTLRHIMLEERYSFRQTWTFPMSLLYALTLVTTIGYGFYTPSTLLARSLTTAYSLLGIPLFLLYLSVVGERLARIINRMTTSCCGCCDGREFIGDEDAGGRLNRRRLGAYRQYSDVTLALQPMSYQHGQGHGQTGSNGHVSQLEMAQNDGQFKNTAAIGSGGNLASVYCCCAPDTTQVPLLVCAGLLAVFIGLSSLLLVLFEPQLGFVESLHLTVNLLMTLGFAGNLLPGMSAEAAALLDPADTKDGRHHQGVGSQVSLILVACLILLGTTLLSSSFNVLMDSISHIRSVGGPASGQNEPRTATTYHHMPSPSRQLS